MKNNRKGFTLIELLVVVLIIGILAAVALPQYTTAVEKSRATEALTLMNAIAQSAQRFRLQKDRWPTGSEFDKLDIEVPTTSGGGYGGKNFGIEMGKGPVAGADEFLILTPRNLTGNKHYVLATLLRENNNGSVSVIRSCCPGTMTISSGLCAAAAGTETEAQKYCDAITNGHNNDF